MKGEKTLNKSVFTNISYIRTYVVPCTLYIFMFVCKDKLLLVEIYDFTKLKQSKENISARDLRVVMSKYVYGKKGFFPSPCFQQYRIEKA